MDELISTLEAYIFNIQRDARNIRSLAYDLPEPKSKALIGFATLLELSALYCKSVYEED